MTTRGYSNTAFLIYVLSRLDRSVVAILFFLGRPSVTVIFCISNFIFFQIISISDIVSLEVAWLREIMVGPMSLKASP